MIIVGVVGKKSSGKSTFAKFVSDILKDFKVKEFSLAKPLKDFVVSQFTIDPKHVWGTENEKNYPIDTWGRIFSDKVLEKYTKDSHDLLSGREFLQIVGTDIMRQGNLDFLQEQFQEKINKFIEEKFGEGVSTFNEIWIDLLFQDIEKCSSNVVVIPDVRFKNEFDALTDTSRMKRDYSVSMIRLYRNAGTTDSIPHASELEMETIPDSSFSHVLYEEQNKTLGDLRKFTTRVLMAESLLPVGGIAI